MDIFLDWRSTLKSKQIRRTYRHLDKPLNLNNDTDFSSVVLTLRNLGAHQFLPFLKFIKKEIRYRKVNGKAQRSLKPRPIMCASHLDAHIYSFFNYIWSTKYEKFLCARSLSNAVLAYRKVANESEREAGRMNNNIQFAKEVFDYIREKDESVVIIADISHFFDQLNHFYLKARMCEVFEIEKLEKDEYRVFKSITSFRYIKNDQNKFKVDTEFTAFKKKMFCRVNQTGCSTVQATYDLGRNLIKGNRSNVGIPQGSPVSGLLANIYLSKFDTDISNISSDMLYRRYSDDVIIVCRPGASEEIYRNLKEAITESLLEINDSKVSISYFKTNEEGSLVIERITNGAGQKIDKGFIDYLGFEFNGERVLFRGRTLQRAYRKGRSKIQSYLKRQGKKYKHKKNRSVSTEKRRTGQYMQMSQNVMRSISSSGLRNQGLKFSKFLSRNRRKERIE